MTLAPLLPERQGHVGAIESITIDGKRWFFGFDYSSDLVVSPLIDDAAVMAAFAAQYMEQMDGPQDAAYWRQLVDSSIEESELAREQADRAFSSAEFSRVAAEIGGAQAGNHASPGLKIQYHVLYLLATAAGDVPPPDDAAYAAAMKRLGLHENDTPINGACDALEILAQSRPLPDGATFADAAALLRVCLAALVNRAPGNWRTLFQGLIAG